MYYHCMYGTRTHYTVCPMQAMRLCANTLTRNNTVGKSMGRERRKNGKYKYANTRVVFELMHATKVSCNVVCIGNTNMLITVISIPSHCAARWEVSPLNVLSRIVPKAQ